MTEKKREYSQYVKDQYDRLIDAFAELEIDGITIMTGNNGSGKSLIRKQLPYALRERGVVQEAKDAQKMIASTSMDKRTGSNPEMGALSGAMRDLEWIATSQNTFSNIKGIIDHAKKKDSKTKYIVIDEYEIGCSEETIMALAMYINKELNALVEQKKITGALIITHSRLGVQLIKHDTFINIFGQ